MLERSKKARCNLLAARENAQPGQFAAPMADSVSVLLNLGVQGSRYRLDPGGAPLHVVHSPRHSSWGHRLRELTTRSEFAGALRCAGVPEGSPNSHEIRRSHSFLGLPGLSGEATPTLVRLFVRNL